MSDDQKAVERIAHDELADLAERAQRLSRNPWAGQDVKELAAIVANALYLVRGGQ